MRPDIDTGVQEQEDQTFEGNVLDIGGEQVLLVRLRRPLHFD